MSAAKGENTRGNALKKQMAQYMSDAYKQLDWDLIKSKPTTKARIAEMKRQEGID